MESDGTSTPAPEAPSSTSVSGTESGGLPFEVIVGLVIGILLSLLLGVFLAVGVFCLMKCRQTCCKTSEDKIHGFGKYTDFNA